jgi:hypothetical protein
VTRPLWCIDRFVRQLNWLVTGTIDTWRPSPIVGTASTSTGLGSWLVAADGGIFAFGDATFSFSAAGRPGAPAVGIRTTTSGYVVVRADGTVVTA